MLGLVLWFISVGDRAAVWACLEEKKYCICVVIKQHLTGVCVCVENQMLGKNEMLVLPLSQVLAENFIFEGSK